MTPVPWPDHDAHPVDTRPADEHIAALLARHAHYVAECVAPNSVPLTDLRLERSILATMAAGHSVPIDPDHFADPVNRVLCIALEVCIAHDHEPGPGFLDRVLLDCELFHLASPDYGEWIRCEIPARLPLGPQVAELRRLAARRVVLREAVALACVAADSEATGEELGVALIAVAGALREC